jgi:copper chaperone CopZ
MSSSEPSGPSLEREGKSAMNEAIYRVPEVHCGACERSIRNALGRLDGIRRVEVDLERREVRVEYDADRTDAAAVRARIERAGFGVE